MKVVIASCVLVLASLAHPTDANPTRAKLNDYLEKEAGAGFSGAVLVANGGGASELDQAYGPVAKAEGRPIFWLASISKPITATAILKLQDQKKLSVHDPLTRFFKDVPADKRSITIHQLLTHTSGLPLKYAADGIADRDKAVHAILALPLEHAPGEKWGYSGDGFVLLAAIVEVASGKHFEDYVRREIFKPAGMKEAGFWGDAGSSRVAPAADPSKLQKLMPTVFRQGKPIANWGWRGSTGMYGSTHDLYAFMVALKNGSLLSTASQTQMWSGYAELRRDPVADTYNGYGWIVDIKEGAWRGVRHIGEEVELGHNGIVTMQKNGDIIIVLSNSGSVEDEGWSTRVFIGVRKLLKG